MMISFHEHVLDRLNAYLDRTLSPADSAAVKRHCDRCASCRGGARAARRRAEERSYSGAWSRLSSFFWMTLAVAAVVLAGFHVHYTNAEAIAVRPSGAGSDRVAAGHGRVAPLAGSAARRRAGTRRPGHGRADGSRARPRAVACNWPA